MPVSVWHAGHGRWSGKGIRRKAGADPGKSDRKQDPCGPSGLCVTAVIQSSSATTVMVVGFVNSGIMKLTQAVGVIMGANIGTTVTSWILSLAGIESENFFIQLLKPSSFSPILALIGVVLLLFRQKRKKERYRNYFDRFCCADVRHGNYERRRGAIGRCSGIYRNPTTFSNPVFGVLAGTVLTAVIQSSFRIGRYPSGSLYDRGGPLCVCPSYHHGTEYRYLCDCPFVCHRCQEKCQTCCNDAFYTLT